ncbi:MAG: single-stranded DNA-binding protein [Bacteroidales bacterium]|jgi:single-strand DNA-binding protein|nr:single-stranded DNA-binding protein [Bacteroidales bacterium]
MSGVNKVILVGRLGKDPEIRTFENNVKKASFTMATSEYYKDKNGNRVEQTEWHNIICWRGLADNAEKYLNKGKMIYLEGKLRTRSWDDNGVKKYTTEIEANTFTILSPKGENSGGVTTQMENHTENVASVAPPAEPVFESDTDDLPF